MAIMQVLPAAPWIERLRSWPGAAALLGGITAAVVGAIADLALGYRWELLSTCNVGVALVTTRHRRARVMGGWHAGTGTASGSCSAPASPVRWRVRPAVSARERSAMHAC